MEPVCKCRSASSFRAPTSCNDAEPSFQLVLRRIRTRLWSRRLCSTQRWRLVSTATSSRLHGMKTEICTPVQATTASLASPALRSPSSVYKVDPQKWAAATHRPTGINRHQTVVTSRRWAPMFQCKALMRRRHVPPGTMAYPTSSRRASSALTAFFTGRYLASIVSCKHRLCTCSMAT